jgi:hypothetical protein
MDKSFALKSVDDTAQLSYGHASPRYCQYAEPGSNVKEYLPAKGIYTYNSLCLNLILTRS